MHKFKRPRISPLSIAKWALLAAASWIVGKQAEKIGLPAPHLLVAVILGFGAAVTGMIRGNVPGKIYTSSQAVTGVVIGSFFSLSALQSTGPALLPLLLVTLATLGLSLLGGVIFARVTGVDRASSSLGMVAGGSAAIVAASDEMGADPRIVAFMQYLRLALVVLSTPFLIRFLFPGHGHFAALGAHEIEVSASSTGFLFVALCAPLGLILGRRLRLPAASLLGPVILAAAANLAGIGVQPPEILREAAFTVIGLEVGLRFTPATVRSLGRLIPGIAVFVVGVTAVCGLLAWALASLTNVSLLNAYLATTPGGINAVLATASTTGANVTLVFAVQTLRLFVMVLAAPPLLRYFLNRSSRLAEVETLDRLEPAAEEAAA